MNALTFISAYRQLAPHEKSFVDSYVEQIERQSERANERISNALYRPIPAEIVANSGGMLTKPMVLAAITERINAIAQASELTPARIIKEYMHLAFSSIGDYFEIDENGFTEFSLDSLTPGQLAAIKKIKIDQTLAGRKYEIELHSKLDALNVLAKYAGIVEPDNPHWRQENARPVNPAHIDHDASVSDVQNAYAQLIEGD